MEPVQCDYENILCTVVMSTLIDQHGEVRDGFIHINTEGWAEPGVAYSRKMSLRSKTGLIGQSQAHYSMA